MAVRAAMPTCHREFARLPSSVRRPGARAGRDGRPSEAEARPQPEVDFQLQKYWYFQMDTGYVADVGCKDGQEKLRFRNTG